MMTAAGSATGFWVALANHLWQSTLCAALAALLVLALRRNRASVRCGVWLAASVKFLVPFAAIAALGSRLAMRMGANGPRREFTLVVEIAGAPFSPAGAAAIAHTDPMRAGAKAAAALLPLLPAALGLIWLLGCIACLGIWWVRWRRIALQAGEAEPVTAGRELEALRRVEQAWGARRPLALRRAEGPLEPGVFGIFRPVLLWPAGISAHLDDGQLEAILAHEIAHVRRRDNLTAALHLLVQAIFWFHPLVWWVGARLVDERERACDEEVVTAGSNPEVYAESLLRACRFCVESPLACVSGVTGADLKARVVRIVTQPPVRRLGLAEKLLLGTAAVAAIGVPMAFGMMHPVTLNRLTASRRPLPDFHTATIRLDESGSKNSSIRFTPDGFAATNVDLRLLIREAWGVEDAQLAGVPDWTASSHYDVVAKLDPAGAEQAAGASMPERWQMLRSVLVSRFGIRLHQETREIPVFALVTAPGGPRLIADAEPPSAPRKERVRFGIRMSMNGDLVGTGAPMSVLVRTLAFQPEIGGKPVVDQTGLTGRYDWELKWEPAVLDPLLSRPGPIPSRGRSLFLAVRRQLGLQLEPATAPVPIVVIDHIDRAASH